MLINSGELKYVLLSQVIFILELVAWGKIFSDNYRAIMFKIARLGIVSIFVYIWFTALHYA